MSDDGDPAHPKQWRPAVFRVVDLAPKLLVGAPRKHVTHLRSDRALERLFEYHGDMLGHAFADLQSDIAEKTVADNHFHASRKNVASFDVAYEIERQVFKPIVRLFGELVALGFFLAYGEQRHLGPPRAEDHAIINLAHYRKLQQMAHF